MEIIGWSAEQNKFRKDINLCHLIVMEDDRIHSTCACGKVTRTSDTTSDIPPVRVCRECRRIAKRQDSNL